MKTKILKKTAKSESTTPFNPQSALPQHKYMLLIQHQFKYRPLKLNLSNSNSSTNKSNLKLAKKTCKHRIVINISSRTIISSSNNITMTKAELKVKRRVVASNSISKMMVSRESPATATREEVAATEARTSNIGAETKDLGDAVDIAAEDLRETREVKAVNTRDLRGRNALPRLK